MRLLFAFLISVIICACSKQPKEEGLTKEESVVASVDDAEATVNGFKKLIANLHQLDTGYTYDLVKQQDVINEVLRMYGVSKNRSRDEFDAVGLGRHRSTEDWIEGNITKAQKSIDD